MMSYHRVVYISINMYIHIYVYIIKITYKIYGKHCVDKKKENLYIERDQRKYLYTVFRFISVIPILKIFHLIKKRLWCIGNVLYTYIRNRILKMEIFYISAICHCQLVNIMRILFIYVGFRWRDHPVVHRYFRFFFSL